MQFIVNCHNQNIDVLSIYPQINFKTVVGFVLRGFVQKFTKGYNSPDGFCSGSREPYGNLKKKQIAAFLAKKVYKLIKRREKKQGYRLLLKEQHLIHRKTSEYTNVVTGG